MQPNDQIPAYGQNYGQPPPQQPYYQQPPPQQFAPQPQAHYVAPPPNQYNEDMNYNQNTNNINNEFLPPVDNNGFHSCKSLAGSARNGFITKVYSILSCQLLCTTAFVSLTFFSESFWLFMRHNIWVLAITTVITLVSLYSLVCYPPLARKVPTNYILLSFFTIGESWSVAFICCFYDGTSVLIAAGTTCAMVIGLTAYAASRGSKDFTKCGGFLFACLFSFMIGSFFLSVFWGQNREVMIATSCIGVAIFSIYIIYDTQLIMGEKSHKFSIDDYILAAMNLYLDIIQIFLYLLKIFGSRR